MGNNQVVVLLAVLTVGNLACVGRAGQGQGASTTASDATVGHETAQTDLRPAPNSEVAPVKVPRPVQVSAPDGGARPGSDLRTASEIRLVVRRYLKTSRTVALRNLPTDWGHALPKDAGEASADAPPAGGFSLPPWRLDIDGDRAKLTYVPPGGLTPSTRLWFQLDLERARDAQGRDGGWKVLAPGMTFAHADPRRR